MAKSYLISLNDSDLEALIFSVVDRALKLNKLAGGNADIDNATQKKAAVKNVTVSKPAKELVNG